jgi:hypothetical protein
MGTPEAELKQQEGLAVFHHAAEEIRFFKRQQWLVTNYALAAYAVLVAAPELLGDPQDVAAWLYAAANWTCAAVVVIAAIGAWYVLCSLDQSHDKELNRMDAARWNLPLVQEIHARFMFKPGIRSPRPGRLMWLLGAVLASGAFLAFSISYLRIPQNVDWLAAGMTVPRTQQSSDPTAPKAAQSWAKVFTYHCQIDEEG